MTALVGPDGHNGGPTGPAGAELCRVSVLGEHTQVDLALPAHTPVALLLPGVVELVAPHGAAGPARWALAPVGHAPVDPTRTLDELGLRDGELLVLTLADAAAPPPLFDDIVSAVAAFGAARHRQWDAACARWLGYLVAAAAALGGALALLRDGAGAGGGAASLPLAALAVAAVLLGASAAASRVYDDGAGVALAACAVPLAAAGGALLVPGALAGPHLLLSCVGAATAAAVGLWCTRSGPTVLVAATTAGAAGAAAAALPLVTSVSHRQVALGLLAAVPLLLAAAPRLAMLLAALPLPPVPSPGTALDPFENDPQPVMEPVGTVGSVALSTARSLQQRAEQAQQYLTGLLGGITASTLAAAAVAVGALWPAPGAAPNYPGLAVVGLVAAVLMLRGRSYADRPHALTLIGGGAAVALTLLTVGALPAAAPPLALFAAAAAMLAAAFAFGVLAPAREFSPVQRRAVEIAEYLAITAIVPVACWALGLYSLLRGL